MIFAQQNIYKSIQKETYTKTDFLLASPTKPAKNKTNKKLK